MALLACPFCRELYGDDEAERCPHCDLVLVPLASLPPSADALAEQPPEAPEDQRFGFFFLGAGRGLGLLLNLAGLACFFLPWFSLARPDPVLLSGADLARGNAPWLLGGALGFALNLPLLLSRRSLYELTGVRAVAFTFALMTACEVIVLVLKPPLQTSYFSVGLSQETGLWASFVLSVLAAIVCLRLGSGRESESRAAEEAPTVADAPRPKLARRKDHLH